MDQRHADGPGWGWLLRRRRHLAGAMAVVGLALAWGVVAHLRSTEFEEIETRFQRRVDSHFFAIRAKLELTLHCLHAVEAFFSHAEKVTRREFETFTSQIRHSNQVRHTLAWIPRVRTEQRQTFEAQAREEGLADFRITERDGQGRLVPAGAREEYLPLYYITSPAGPELALGYDLASNPAHRQALERARDGRTAVTIRLADPAQGQAGGQNLLALAPVYRDQSRTHTPAERREGLLGFALTELRLSDLIEQALVEIMATWFNLAIYEEDDQPGGVLLYRHVAQPGQAGETAAKVDPGAPRTSRTLHVVDRRWRLESAGWPDPAQRGRSWHPWWFGLSALAVSWILAASFLGLTNLAARLQGVNRQLTLEAAERRAAEEQLHSLARFPSENPHPVLRLARQGSILYANQAAEPLLRAWGAARGEAAPEEIRRVADLSFEADLRKELTVAYDGRHFILDFVAVPRNDYVNIYGVDITEKVLAQQDRDRLEGQINQTQKMEAIGTLAAGIAHDFNNILSSILGFADLLLLDAPAGWSGREQVAAIQKAGLRAKKLVDQILAFSRQDRPSPRPMSLAALVQETLSLLRASLPANIQVQSRLDAPHPIILADPTRVQQALMNLCSNSAQAMSPQGGLLHIGLDEVDPPDAEAAGCFPGRWLRLTVSDDGQGIAPPILKKIFDPFFTTKPRGEGTGMGLAVVHGVVADLGGRILVHSQPGQGATFEIFLPQARELPPPAEAVATWSVGPLSGRVLFVDDEEDVIHIARQALGRVGLEVVVRRSGEGALEYLTGAESACDLVVTDYSMPKMSGLELAERIKALRPDLPILLVTGYGDGEMTAKSAQAGVVKVLPKPFTLAELLQEVQAILKRR